MLRASEKQVATAVRSGHPRRLAPTWSGYYLPRHVIPYAGSAFRQESASYLSEGTTLLAWDAFGAGRLACGERFGFDRLSGRTRVSWGGVPELVEGFNLSGGEEPFGGYPYLGTVYASAPRGTLRELAELHAALGGSPGILASARAPTPNLCVARVLADGAPALYWALNVTRAAARCFLGLARPPREVR
jgi:urease accessory protein